MTLELLTSMRLFVGDVAAVAVLAVFYVMMEFMRPFERLFFIDDESISYPHAPHERVPILLCLFLVEVIPALIILLIPTVVSRRRNRIRLIYVSLLGLAMCFVLNGFVSNITKLWLGRLRPDFLARCIPRAGTPKGVAVSIEVCTAKDLSTLYEGLKSTPSGHSSTSFSGMLYLSLWLSGQFGASRSNAETYKSLLCFSPLLVATYIAISRTEDYRHHFIDIILGSILGSAIAWFTYRKYFPPVASTKASEPYTPSAETSAYDFEPVESEITV